MKRPIYLSKSRFQSGRQCHKRLWLEVHRRELIQYDASTQARFDEGNRFGELARDLLGGGVTVEPGPREAERALTETAGLMAQPAREVPRIFEAAFEHDGVRIRADALLRGDAVSDLVEVKSSTSVKDEYLWDCAVQSWVLQGAGVALGKIHVGHVDNSFALQEEGDYAGLLKVVDVTAEVTPLLQEVPGIVSRLSAMVQGEEPQVSTGRHCTTPYPCPFIAHCQSQEAPQPDFPVDLLPRSGKLAEELQQDGYLDLRDVPEARLSNGTHRRIALATRTGSAYVAPELTATLDAIPYPRHYLDFETIGPTIPRWIGTRPFQQVPFQFSCHVEQADGSIQHRKFLDTSGESPMPGFVEALLNACGTEGPILVWNQGFEAGRIREMAALFPDKAPALLALEGRMIDLLPLYRAHYYHPRMMGSWSIKAVLPTVAPELDYGELDVSDGGQAQMAWLTVVHPETTPEERERLREAMLKYCERDTWAMVKLAHFRPATTAEEHAG